MSDEEPPKRRRRKTQATGTPLSGLDGSERALSRKVKSARGRKIGSTLWLQRQLNDPYVRMARDKGYRSRAAFKLAELDDKFRFLRKGARVIDLGAAPGGWVQVALERGASQVSGIDLLEMEAISGAHLLVGDFTDADAPAKVLEALGAAPTVVLSDMAANTTGHRATDHLRIVALVDAAAVFAMEVLEPGGAFVAKVFQGGTEGELLKTLQVRFEKVRHAKPRASRPESPETYLVATGFRGRERR